jgi:hypothetical protein
MLARRDNPYLHQHPIPDPRELALKHRLTKAIKRFLSPGRRRIRSHQSVINSLVFWR